jgi:hypothetical protein
MIKHFFFFFALIYSRQFLLQNQQIKFKSQKNVQLYVEKFTFGTKTTLELLSHGGLLVHISNNFKNSLQKIQFQRIVLN